MNRSWNFVVLISCLIVSGNILPHSFEEIARENLRSLEAVPDPRGRNFDSQRDYYVWEFERQQQLDPRGKRQKLFFALDEYEKSHPNQQADIIDFMSVQDLHLICGPRSNMGKHFASQLDRTHTEMGSLMLLHMLVHPIASTQQLHHRQAIVRELATNTSLRKQLDALFRDVALIENLFMMIDIPGFTCAAQKMMLKLVGSSYVPGADALIARLNKSPLAIGTLQGLVLMKDTAWLGVTVAGTTLFPAMALAQCVGVPDKAADLQRYAAQVGASDVVSMFHPVGFITWICKKVLPISSTVNRVSEVVTGMQYAGFSYYALDGVRSNLFLLMCLQKMVASVATYVKTMEAVIRIIEQDPILRSSCTKELEMLQHVIRDLPQKSSDIKLLFDLLHKRTFLGEASMWSHIGNILVAYDLIVKHKDFLMEGIVALGRMEVYLSTAHLYLEGIDERCAWCLPEYSECCSGNEQAAPYIELHDFWNPFLDPAHAVTNSLTLGSAESPRAAIFTGPNAGGKSTTMKAIVECCLLAQTLGIAPARSCILTPFHKIMTYINITDDIAAGNSHFKAGVLRAQDCMAMLQNLGDHEISLTAVDEVFNGTTHAEGQAAAYCLIEAMGLHPRNICISVTHFPLLTRLEAETGGMYFKNYKVSVTQDAQGRITYPYKLGAGIADQNIALDILEQEGFHPDFLKRAHALVAA